MKITKTHYIAQSVKRFWFGRDGFVAGWAALSSGIIISFVAAGTQVATYNINMGQTENYGISAGKYASIANSCSFTTDPTTLATCSNALTQSALAYLNQIGAPQAIKDSLVITPGVWCPAENKFVSTADIIAKKSSCNPVANNSPLTSIQASLTSNWSPSAMKSQLSRLNQRFKWTFVGTKVDEVVTTAVCPITIDRRVMIKANGDANLYDDKNGTLTAEGKKEIKIVYGRSATYGSEVVDHPMYLMNTSGADKPSLPTVESGSNWQTWSALSSGTDSNGKKRTKVFDTSANGITDSPLAISQSKIGQTFTDPKYGKRNYSDNPGQMIFRSLKDFEGKSCIALLHEGSEADKKTINEAVEIRVNKVCTGSRDRKSDGKGGYIKDDTDSSKYKMFSMDEAHKNYDTDCPDGTLNSPEHSIRFFVLNRTSESDNVVKSDYSKYEGRNSGSTKETKGLKGTHEMAQRTKEYVN